MSPKSPKPAKATQKPSPRKGGEGFTAEERAAMRERSRELKASAADGELAVLEKLEAMPEPDRSLGLRLHALIRTGAPTLTTRLWYGMPAYAREGKVLCFFQAAQKFKTRYATLGFSDVATLDDGNLWPVAFGLNALTPADEARIVALLQQAVR